MSKSFYEFKTVRDLIRYGVSQFNQANLYFGHGTDNAWDEAVYLVLFSLNLPLDNLEPFLDARLLESEKKRCLDLIDARVKKRTPLAYLTGESWLQGYRFISDKRVIVPRSPISELLVQQLSPWIEDPEEDLEILDMCTGSGNLAIIAALNFPFSHVDAVDLSDYAIRLAQRNVEMYQLQSRVNVVQSDLFTELPLKKYDFIIANPPYVNSTSMRNLPSEYQREPVMALDGGEDGMDFVRKILNRSAEYLKDKGFILLEIGNEYENFLTAFPSINSTFLETETTQECIVLLTRDDLLMLD